MCEAVVSLLLWVSGMTRPDIVSAVRAVARQTHNPSSRHWKAVVKIIAYLKRTKDLGLLFVRGGDFVLSVYVDADYASQSNWRRSVSGVCGRDVGGRFYQCNDQHRALHYTLN